jgi:hypothetical protein
MTSHRHVFSLEQDMLPALRRTLPKAVGIARHHLVSVLTEPFIGGIIPDILIGETSRQNTRSLQRRITFLQASVLALVERHPQLAEGEVLSQLHITPQAARRALEGLERAGAIRRESSGEVRLRRAAATSHLVITAVEVKLKRWREALAQAISYRRFADRVFIVLDGNRVSPSNEALLALAAASVGLFLQYRTKLELVLKAPRVRTISPDRFDAVQKLLDA